MAVKALASLLFALTLLPLATAADAPGQFKFGILAPAADGQSNRVASETLVIPYKFKDTGFRWGFEFSPTDPAAYNLRVVFYLPSAPATITGSLEGGKDSPTIVKDPEVKETGRTTRSYYFDAGDPTGDWKIEIFIDGKLSRTFKFEVTPEK